MVEWIHNSKWAVQCCCIDSCVVEGGGGWRERVLQFAVATLCSDALCFADDDFGEEGARAVARMLELNSCMTKVDFGKSVFCKWFATRWGGEEGGGAGFRALLEVTRVQATKLVVLPVSVRLWVRSSATEPW